LNNDAFPHYPSSYDLDNLIAVAATDHNDDLAFFSNYGTVSVDVAAPGQNILSTVDGGGYAYYSGTSMAAPHVAAIAALMLEQNPTMSPLQIRDRLIETSDIRSDLANSTVSGGRVNAGEAVAWQGPGSITGTVWNDVDRDGLRDPAEIGLAGRRVYIDANQNGQRDEGERTAITNASGVYSFTDLTPGRYMIAQELPSGSDQTSPLAPTDYSWHDNRSGEIGFSWVDISQSGKTLSLRDDDSALVSLPFAFEFYGEVQDELRISSNGYLTFGNSGSAYMNGRLGQADGTDGIIAPFWDDLNPARGGRIYYGLDDKGEKFVVTYENVQPFSGSSSYTFQVIMDQSGAITFQYLEMTGTVNRATIGIEDTSGTSGLELAYNSTFVENGLAVQMAPVATRQIGIEVQVDAGQTTSGVNFGATVGAPVVAEFGYLFAVTEQAQTVVLDNIFENPVVFAFAQSHDNADPFITRISDVQNGQFTLRLQEPDYADNVTSQIAVAYVVMEEGAWELPNGAILEVGSFTASANAPWSWDNVSFDAAFEDTPAVFGQTQTENDSSFVQARVSSVDADGFRVALQEEEAEKFNTHADEDVGWFAISESTGIWGDMRYEASLFEARETEASYEFDNAYTGAPVVFADMMSSWGIDPSWAQAGQVTEDSVTLYTQEETSTDQELVHATETFGVLAIAGTGQATATAWEAGVISGRLWNDADGDQSVSSREGGLSGWTVYLDANNNGQRDSGEVTSQSDMYGHYRFAGLSADTYTVRVDAPSGWDATTSATQTLSLSAEEDATYVDFGLQSPDRTIMEFGSLEALTHVAQTIELNGSFENPVVIAQITSLNE
ncbi:MAG: S8 family serine peptidase, partial [Mangrovicoccus sp.]